MKRTRTQPDAPTDTDDEDREKVVLRLKLELAGLREENKKLREVNNMNGEALRETSRIFQKLKPVRPTISAERKLYIAGEQLFKCHAPHGRERCPMWLLNDGSFDAAGFEIDHELKWAQSYRHVGQLRALCAHCHNLKSRLERIALAEEAENGGVEEDE